LKGKHIFVEMIRCPTCGSRDIYPVAGGYIGQIFRCKKCGYRGSFVLETDDDDDSGKDS
jgi:transposase-like protein